MKIFEHTKQSSMEFGERLQQIMEYYDISTDKLSELLGCGTRTIQQWLDGEADPSVMYLYKICLIFSVSADYMLFGKSIYQCIADGPEQVSEEKYKEKLERAIKLLENETGRCPGNCNRKLVKKKKCYPCMMEIFDAESGERGEYSKEKALECWMEYFIEESKERKEDYNDEKEKLGYTE